MRVRAIRGIAVAGLVLGLLGCGDDDDDSTTAGGPDPGSTEPDGGTDAESSTTEDTLPPAFEDGTYFGYISDIDVETDGGPYADFDVARLYTGDAALQAQADDVPGCEEVVDYCIDNADDTHKLVPIVDDADVLDIDIAGDCCEAATGDLETFDADRNPPDTPVEITVADGEITRIEEIYFP